MEAIREFIHSPQDWNRIIKTLPPAFAGRDLELIIIPRDEPQREAVAGEDAKLFGALHKYADQRKISLEKDAWKEHVKDD